MFCADTKNSCNALALYVQSNDIAATSYYRRVSGLTIVRCNSHLLIAFSLLQNYELNVRGWSTIHSICQLDEHKLVFTQKKTLAEKFITRTNSKKKEEENLLENSFWL